MIYGILKNLFIYIYIQYIQRNFQQEVFLECCLLCHVSLRTLKRSTIVISIHQKNRHIIKSTQCYLYGITHELNVFS